MQPLRLRSISAGNQHLKRLPNVTYSYLFLYLLSRSVASITGTLNQLMTISSGTSSYIRLGGV